MRGGTYTLLIGLAREAILEVGALGEHTFPGGWYAYTGSALGSAGFTRVQRHCELAAGERDVRHWHIDYLLGHPETLVVADTRSEVNAECTVARALPEGPVAGFGASDCDCQSHLAYRPDRAALEREVRTAHEAVR